MPAVACPLCRQGEAGRAEALVPAEAVLATLRQAKDLGATAVTLRDGDLLARPEALDILGHARSLALQVELWTNGPVLARPGIAEAVVKAGAVWLGVPLYGDTAQAHDYVAGQPGHFQRTLAGLQKVRAAGGRAVIVAPILRPTFRNLPLLVQKSLALQVQAFRFVAPVGRDREQHPLCVPAPLTAQALRAALQLVTAGKRRATVLDVPACVLGEEAKVLDLTQVLDARGAHEPTLTHEHGKPCETCLWRERCPGLPQERALQHGWVGIAPVLAPLAAAS
jgi:hypothetical protein